MQIEWQPGLFGARSEAAQRIDLDATSWVEHRPGWLADPDSLFAELVRVVPWQQRKRLIFERVLDEPRLTGEYTRLADVPSRRLVEAAERLGGEYGVRYDGLWLNLYRDGRDSTAWHGDKISCKRERCVVPVLTLGASRRFLLRARAGGPSVVLRPAAGDLVVMGGRCQRDWLHAVPKAADVCGARISVNFMSSEQAKR